MDIEQARDDARRLRLAAQKSAEEAKLLELEADFLEKFLSKYAADDETDATECVDEHGMPREIYDTVSEYRAALLRERHFLT